MKESRFRRLATGGRDVLVGDHPWFGGLVKRMRKEEDYSAPFCGASLISNRYLITAGHCVYGKRPQDLAILMNLYDLNEFDAQLHLYNISRLIVHEHYVDNEKRPEVDIALIQLERPVRINHRIRPLCLPDRVDHRPSVVRPKVNPSIASEPATHTEEEKTLLTSRHRITRDLRFVLVKETNVSRKNELSSMNAKATDRGNSQADKDGSRSAHQHQPSSASASTTLNTEPTKYVGLLTAVGWGRLSRNGPQADRLQQVSMPQDVSSCTLVYGEKFHQNHICLKDTRNVKRGWKDVCKGDSGGPLIHRWNHSDWLVGVTSYGNCLGVPAAVFTRIASYLDWIQRNTMDSVYCARPDQAPLQ